MSTVDFIKQGSWLDLEKWEGSCYAHRILHQNTKNFVQRLGPSHIDGNIAPNQDESGSPDYHLLIKQSNPGQECPVPEHVICMLTINIRKTASRDEERSSRRFLYDKAIQFPWLWLTAYEDIRKIMESFVEAQGPAEKRFYLGSSHVRLMAWDSSNFCESDSRTVEIEQHWKRHVPRMIAQYCGKNHNETAFYLEINTDFEWFIVEPFGFNKRRDFKESIQSTLRQTRSINHERKEYWARKVLKRLFDLRTIRDIVDDFYNKKKDKDIYVSPENRDPFVKWLWDDHIRLLAIIIQSHTKLHRLYKLRQLELENPEDKRYKITDQKIPLRDCDLELFLKGGEITTFRAVQGGFKPIDFSPPGTWKHQVLQNDEIVPIYYDDSNLLGDGGSGGSVYAATIHPDHHAYSTNKNDTFALKILGNSVRNHAQEEMKALQYVADQPHNHITTFYTSWAQNGRFYMLSPRADMSLRSFLFGKNTKPFEKKCDTEWLLEQTEGLASGVQHIHHIGRAGLKTQSSSGRKIDCGYHHDLKPDNVLVFVKRVWKISDFGTTKIRSVVSSSATVPKFYTKNLPKGDEEYGSPDYLNHDVGRSYDVWSLGCIFLEVLLWAFGEGHFELNKFRADRSDEIQDHCSDGGQISSNIERVGSERYIDSNDVIDSDPMPNFWFRCKKCKEIDLKRCVAIKLDWLKRQAESELRLLLPLCELVEKMLSINPANRPPASAISDQIGTLRVRAKIYFAHQRKVTLDQVDDDTQMPDPHEESVTSEIGIGTKPFSQSFESKSRRGSPKRRERAYKSGPSEADSFDLAGTKATARGRRKRSRSPGDPVRDMPFHSRDITGAGLHVHENSDAFPSSEIGPNAKKTNKRRNTAIDPRTQGVISSEHLLLAGGDTRPRLGKDISTSVQRTPVGQPESSQAQIEDGDDEPFPEVDTMSIPPNDRTWIAKLQDQATLHDFENQEHTN